MFRNSKYRKKQYDGGIPIHNRNLLSVRLPKKGSLTLEAAIVLPLFLLFMTAILSFLILISLQSEIQMTMEETARSIGKKAYLAEHLANRAEDSAPDEGSAGFLSAGINSFTIKSWMLKEGLADRIRQSSVRGGTDGFYVYHSGYDRKKGILDIVVNYTYEFPFLPESFGAVRQVQRSCSHVWTGKRLKDSAKERENREDKTVYITPSGSAYHLSTSCPYLDLSVRSVSEAEVGELRNKDGKIYYRCTDCCRSGESYGTVYVTDYGTNWHCDLRCSGLKRTVEAVLLSEVKDRHVCSRCSQLFGSTEQEGEKK